MEINEIKFIKGGMEAYDSMIDAYENGIPIKEGLYLFKENDHDYIAAEVYKGDVVEEFDSREKALLWLLDQDLYEYIYEGEFI